MPFAIKADRRDRVLRFLRRMRRSRNVVVGSFALSIIVFCAIFAPILTPYDPTAIAPQLSLQAPNFEHPFGTDNFGRDILSRVLHGARLSLLVGLISVAIASSIGTFLGLVAGYFGGIVDTLIMRMVDVMLAFPGILLALAIVAVLGKSLPNVMIAVGISTIPIFARIVRGSTLSVKQLDYIVAAQALGCPTPSLILRHILPNVITPIIVIATNGVAGAIISGAALSFLGLGAQPPTPEWGIILAEGRVYLRAASWVTTYPGLAIMLTVLSINLLGDGLRDVLDPRLKV